MSKFVTLTLDPKHESEYGEYANLPVFDSHGNIIGWVGGEVPESGHPCEFNVMGDDGFTSCHSSTEIMRLRKMLESYAKAFVGYAAENNGNGRWMEGPDWLELANELRMEMDGVDS